MDVRIYRNVEEMATAAAELAARKLLQCIAEKERVSFMAATGVSQLAFISALTRHSEVDWHKTTMFHLDEYVGLPETHTASFRNYLREHLVNIVHPGQTHFIDGNASDLVGECTRLTKLVSEHGLDVAFVGIGENGHLGFNDPPADFDTQKIFEIVQLTETCRAQQVHEGWFPNIEDVPREAVTITIPGIMRAESIICNVPESRKAVAVKNAIAGSITPMCPASILKKHSDAMIFLDRDSSSMLDRNFVKHNWMSGK